jgi:putative transposase
MTPRVMVTDKLGSYGAARREMGLSFEHRQHKGLNDRAENSHQPTRRRERQMKRFKSMRQAQSFLSIHDPISNLFHLRRHQLTAADYRKACSAAFEKWADITSVALAARKIGSSQPEFCRAPVNVTMPFQVTARVPIFLRF